jgi:hypothetical protein
MVDDGVRIDDLRQVVNRILDFIDKDLGMAVVPLERDYYWSIPEDTLYAMKQEPAQLDCGSLRDDLDFVRSAQRNPEEALPLVLLHVAPLLRALATSVPNFTSSEGRDAE